MEKLTDNEIIKALEYCTNNDDCGTDCTCFSEKQSTCGDYNGLLKQTIDIINRQKAEIEMLQAVADAELDTIHKLGDDYERALEKTQELVKKAKAEAVKELQKRIHEKLHEAEMNGVYDLVVTKDMFDDAVKEMGV